MSLHSEFVSKRFHPGLSNSDDLDRLDCERQVQCVLLCFIEPIVGDREPGVLNRGHRIHARSDLHLTPMELFTNRKYGVAPFLGMRQRVFKMLPTEID